MKELTIVGKSVPRLDALEKVTGKALYCADLTVKGMLQTKILRSPFPHAKILNIDTSRAQMLNGVKAVLTANDIPTEKIGLAIRDRPVLAQQVVRFVGEPVVAVAATSADIAREAVERIEVNYEELPAIFDPEEALRESPSVRVHPHLFQYSLSPLLKFLRYEFDPDLPNCFMRRRIYKGNVEEGFKKADLIVENRFSTNRLQHCAMEPHAAIARFEPGGSLTLWSTEQAIWRHKYELCRVFNLPSSKLRLITPYVGGAFGGKSNMHQVTSLAVLLALKTEGTVNLTLSREEVFVDGFVGCPMVIYIKDGLKKDGTLVARQVKLILDAGAYSGTAAIIAYNAGYGAVSPYKIPDFKLDSYAVATNNLPGGAFRGFGVRQVTWAIESQMNMIAEKLGIDPAELREKNLLNEGDVNACGEVIRSIGARECLKKVTEWIEWGKESRGEQGSWKRGKGFALGSKFTTGATSSVALVKVHDDATIEIRHSGAELGQGCNTVLAQIAAEEFRTPAYKVKVVYTDTDVTPYDWATTSSRITYHIGNALRLACQDAKRQLLDLAAKRLELSPEDLAIEDERIHVASDPTVAIKIGDLFAPGGYLPRGGELIGKATYTCPRSNEDPETGQGDRLVAYYAYGAVAAEVAFNIETGEVKLLKLGGCFDMGYPINPSLCEAQIEGGLGMGVGSALFEEMKMETGKVMNPNFADYRIPTFTQMPPLADTKSMLAPTPFGEGPFGAKSVGEIAIVPVAPAVANAIYNAVKIRIKDLPLTVEKCLKTLEEATACRESNKHKGSGISEP